MENVLNASSLRYGLQERLIVDGFELSLNKGEMLSIVGPNGSGKSTILRLLSRLLAPKQGAVMLEGEDIARMDTKRVARKLTMLPQTQDHLLDLTVLDLVKQGRHPHLKWFEECRGEHLSIVEWAVEMMDLGDMRFRSLYTLSGGERQRAWIAMALAQLPQTLLLDEPTTYLDISHQIEIMELIRHLNAELHMTIVMVLHDLNQASRYSDRMIAVKDGKIARSGTPEQLFEPSFFREVFQIEASVRMEDGVPVYMPSGSSRTFPPMKKWGGQAIQSNKKAGNAHEAIG